MPDNLVGLVLFVAFITPGYLWVRLEERARPRPDRSGLLEVAELLTIGVLASLFAAAFVGWLGARVPGLLDVSSWADAERADEYLAEHWIKAGVSLLGVVLSANVGVLDHSLTSALTRSITQASNLSPDNSPAARAPMTSSVSSPSG